MLSPAIMLRLTQQALKSRIKLIDFFLFTCTEKRLCYLHRASQRRNIHMRPILFTALTIGIMTSALAEAPASAPVTAPASASTSQGNSSTAASDATAAKSDQAIRCRTVRVTGSLVKKGKVCKTLAQWRQMTESGNELARRLVEDGTSRPGGQ
jgi:hypothetical protein